MSNSPKVIEVIKSRVRRGKREFRLYSKKRPSRALGPWRKSRDAVKKDEKRVQYFKHRK